MRRVWFKIIDQSITKVFLVCGFVLMANTGSMAADGTELARSDAIESRSKQFDRVKSTEPSFDFSLGVGYRSDNLNWNEAGSLVNIRSELKWENLKISQLTAAARLNFYSGWSLRGALDYGSINSGSNQDSDYNGNDRTLEFSRSNNKGGGRVRDGSISLGRTLRPLAEIEDISFTLTPLVGLSLHDQYLTMTDGFQTIPDQGTYAGLESSYDARWQGPWVGIETQLESGGEWLLTAIGEYHKADYSAQANWNLRPEFSHPVSFAHSAKGEGYLLALGATYIASKNRRVNFFVTSQRWSTGPGIDQTFFSDGSVGYYQLNSVNWNSTAANFGLIHCF